MYFQLTADLDLFLHSATLCIILEAKFFISGKLLTLNASKLSSGKPMTAKKEEDVPKIEVDSWSNLKISR